jgi:hypothetical protein
MIRALSIMALARLAPTHLAAGVGYSWTFAPLGRLDYALRR